MPTTLAKPTLWYPGIDLEHPHAMGLEAAWLFNEGAGSQVSNAIGNRRRGVLTNMNPQDAWTGSDQGFALNFVGGSSQFVALDDFAIISYPMTVHVWVNLASIAAGDALFSIAESTASNKYVALEIRNNHVSAVVRNTTFTNVETTATVATGESFLASAVYVSASEVRVYKNGANEVSGGGFDAWPSGANRSAIGNLYRVSPDSNITGKVGFASVYSIAQTTAEVKSVYEDTFAMFREPDPVWLWDVAAVSVLQSQWLGAGNWL